MKTMAPEALTLRLIQAFLKIRDPKKREEVIDLIEAKSLQNEAPTER